MTALRERMIEDLQLHGLSNNTQVSYVRSVRFLAEYYRKPPDQITEEELREYFLFLIKERRVPPAPFGSLCVGLNSFMSTLFKSTGSRWNWLARPQRKSYQWY